MLRPCEDGLFAVAFHALGFLICGSEMKQSWVCTLVITFNVGFKNPSCHILFREFSSFLRSTSVLVLYLCLLHDSRSHSVQRRVYDSELGFFFFFLSVDSKWHLWDTLIKQFFLLIRPTWYFQHISPHSFVVFFFFFSGRPTTAFCDPQPPKSTETERSVFNVGSLAASRELSETVVPPLFHQIYC